MRGHPLFRFLAIVAIFAMAGMPVWWVTRGDDARAADSTNTSAVTNPSSASLPATASSPAVFSLAITCTHAPDVLSITYLGKEVFSSKASLLQYKGEFSLPGLPAEGGDFVVKATWPQGIPETAMRLAMESGSARREATFWAQSGRVSDVLTFIPAAPTSAVPAVRKGG